MDSRVGKGPRRLTLAAVALLLAFAPAAQATTTHLVYRGGPIMSPITSVFVQWGPNTDASFVSKDESLLSDLAADSGRTTNVFAQLAEYSTSTPAHTLAYSQRYAGASLISPSVGDGSSSTTVTVTDAQVQQELTSQIANGHVPAPAGNGLTTAYVLLFPPKDRLELNSAFSGQNFCVYHNLFTASSLAGSPSIVYAVIPDSASEWDNGAGCGSTSVTADNETEGLTQELENLITDPNPGMGWNDMSTFTAAGDACALMGATNTINGHDYNVNKVWSQALGLCTATSHYVAPTADFSSTPTGDTASFSATAASQNGGTIASYAWSFGDGSTGTGSSPTHTYAHGGSYTVTLTATDNLGFIATPSHMVTITSIAPTIAITTPANGAMYVQHRSVHAAFTCTPGAGSSVTTCVGPVGQGVPIDTSTVGHHNFTVIATDADGTTNNASAGYTVVAPPPPVLTSARSTHSVWREPSKHHRGHGPPVGTKLTFTLNENARVTFSFRLANGGRTVGRSCVKPSHRNRHKPSCALLEGTLTVAGHTGKNTVSFQGLLSGGRKLPPGNYLVLVTATASGRTSLPVRLNGFTIDR
jgi:PKD repeat protein